MRTAALILAFILPAPVVAQIMLGQPEALDGDTIAFGDDVIRLHGIDAPEAPQTCTRAGETWACGEAATDFLGGLLASGRLSCNQIDLDEYGRQISSCSIAGRDIAKEILAAGFAVTTDSENREYLELESNARAMQIGLWSGTFELPREYRAANPDYQAPKPKRVRNRQTTDIFEARPLRNSSATYFRNCNAARAAGVAPIRRGEPGYRAELDADGDGIACEPYRGRR